MLSLIALLLLAKIHGLGVLYWVPNQAGLFSHFLQLKIMQQSAAHVSRTLTIVPTGSPHYGNVTIDMCSIFNLPFGIHCGLPPTDLMCKKNFKEIARMKSDAEVCYSGTITFGSKEKGRKFVLQAVDLPIRVAFTAHYQTVADLFHRTLMQMKSLLEDPTDFAVVHWRRGDQLQGRCTRNVDASVNCGTAAELLQQVKSSTNHSVIYVATNEPQDSPEMAYLSSQGVVTLADVTTYSNDPTLRQPNVFEEVVAEVALMMNAQTFLAWGISEINDVVEHERKLLGRPYCETTRQDPKRDVTEEQQTWCTLTLAAEKGTETSK